MNSRRKLLVIASSVVALGLAMTIHDVALTVDKGANPLMGECSGEGIWLSYGPYGDVWLTLAIPANPSGSKRGMVMEGINFDATLGGTFPGVELSPLRGIAEKVGHNTFTYTLLGYGVNESNEIVYSLRGSGTFWFLDCDTLEGSGAMGFYSPEQDPFGDEYPAYECWPMESTGYRMPNVPPCELP